MLLLDEPLSALDAKLRQHMLLELDAIHDKIGITFLYVTHDQEEAISVSDRLAVMNEGEVLQVGSPSEIYETPADVFVATFVGETNFFSGTVVSVGQSSAVIETKECGRINAFMDKPIGPGDRVTLAVRPEKMRITKERPAACDSGLNCMSGIVDEIIYTGFLSKYFISVRGDSTLHVYKQHVNYFTEESNIAFGEKVHVWWDVGDGFIVEAGAP